MSKEDQLFNFLQKKMQLVQWIEDILRVPIDPDLCKSLKSGLILCYLAKTIDDDLIPFIHDSTHPYKQRENLNMFIETCREMHVPLLKLVTFEDFERNQIVRVVECIHLFATVCIETYDVPPLPNIPKAKVMSSSPSKEDIAIINEQLRLVQRTVIGGKIQDFFALKTINSLKKKLAFRTKVTAEIIKTESDYVDYLREGVTKYEPIIQKYVTNKEIEPDSIQVIFNNLPQITDFNAQFLTNLRSAVNKSSSPNACWVNVFQQLEAADKPYTPYLVNYSQSITRVEQIQCISIISEELAEEKGNDKDISSYLIMPVQRLPRYVLLLTELRKHTWVGHPDLEQLDNMIALVKRKKTRADADRVIPTLFNFVSVGKFTKLPDQPVIYQRAFSLKNSTVVVYLTENYLVVAAKDVVKYAFPLLRIDLLPSSSRADTFKIRVGTKTKLKLQGTKRIPDGGLIRMVNDIKKTLLAQEKSGGVLSLPPTTTKEHKSEFSRDIDPEVELMKRKKSMGGRMSVYAKRTSPGSSGLPIVSLETHRNTNRLSTPNNGTSDGLHVDSLRGASPSDFPKGLTISTLSIPRKPSLSETHRQRTPSHSDSLLRQSTHGGNNELTRNMLRGRPSPIEDGVRPKNSLGNETFSFSELEKLPEGIPKEERVFYLSDADFVELFDVTFEMFKTWKSWRQLAEKQKAGLW
ncbi:Cell division control protein CDC24 [Entamoeba marina]